MNMFSLSNIAEGANENFTYAQRGEVPFETVIEAVADAFAKRIDGALKVL